jgi:amino acid adenylation domain-containing protein
VRWPDGLRQQLEALGRRHGASLFMVLLAGFEALLSRYSGQDDIVVGSLIANRTRPEVERLIGFFVNTLALRGDLSGDPSFAELLGRVRECCLGAYAHQQVPFEKLLVELQPERDLSRTPLFQAMLVLQSHAVPALQLPGVACRVLPVATRRANVDLTVWVTPEPDGLAVVGEYASDLFEPATVTRLLGHLRVLLEAAAADPALRLSELPLLGAAEREQVLVGFNQPTRPAGSTVGLQELFAAQAARTPDVPALLDATQRLTYRQLQQRANQLAHALRGLGVGPEVLVGVCLDRSVEAVVAVLGVLKAGGAWLPLDPAHPPARLGFVLADAGVGVLVSRQQLLDRLPGQALEGVPVVCLDSDYHQIAAQPDHDPAVNTSPDQLAYVIYTSGSTGKPKGVMIEHAAVVNYLSYAGEEFALQPGDRLLQFHSLTVDTSVEEIFSCLSRGATLVIRPESMIDSATAFVRGCSDLGITVLDLPTGYWHELTVGFAREGVTLPACVRLLIIAGEKALPDRLLRWQEHVGERVRLVNTYGPTETAIVATICDLPGAGGIPDGTRELPIGRPVPNLQAYVLDRHLSPVPVGVPGELHVGGVGLARGYLNRPQLTAERFVANPFSDDPPARLYKTGDLGRHLPDGSIEYLGRLDHQVKLRGFRIEPGEIEAVLARHPAVQDAMVVTRDRTPTERQLVAYLVTEPDARMPAVPELRAFLGEQLPGHMIPSVFTTLERLPRTPAGKVDRAALPAPDHARPDLGRERVAPRNPVEGQLAGIWSELLGVEQIGVDDDFFELGGHSMLGVQLLFRIRKTFDVELPLFTVFQTPTVAGLAEIVARRISERRGGRLLDAEEVLARLDELSQEEVDSLLRELSAEQGEVSR